MRPNPEIAVQNPWWRSAVVYQVYPRSFAASGEGGRSLGDLPGVIGRLDYLAELGVDAIWLSPFYRSPQDDNGYDISDYQDVDPMFGSLADVDALVAGAHARGIRIVIDVVVNHTSDEHPWFVASRSGPEDPKRDWYWWRPARPGLAAGAPGAEPTNWASFFSGPAWQLDEVTGEYYLHLFSRKQPDLNWENPQVRQAVYAMLRWWLDRGVDGFRMDVINMISKAVREDGSLPDGVAVEGMLGAGAQHFIDGPRMHEFLQELHREVMGERTDVMTVGEMPGVTVEEAALYTDPARGEVDMVFQFEHVGLDHGASKWDVTPLRLTDLKATFGRWQAGLAETGWNSLYWNNHDQPRAVSRFGDDSPEHRVRSAKLLGTVLHLHRGTPYVYQGEELGLPNAEFGGIEDFQDIESLNHYAAATARGESPEAVLAALRVMSRDNARQPMPWHLADAAVADPGSVFHHYRRLIRLRHDEPAVVLGDFRMLLPDHEQVYAFTRSLGDTSLLVLANFASAPTTVDLPEAGDWGSAELLLASVEDPADAAPVGATMTLGPWEAQVRRLTRRTS